MSTDEMESKILDLIVEATSKKFRKVPMARDTRLKNELGLDSIAMLMMVFRFEQEFGIDLGEMGEGVQLNKLRTVGDLLDASVEILTRTGSAGPG